MHIGESFVGDGADAAHINTVLGPRDGPVGTAWATALATPSAGYARFVVVARPGIAVQPLTLFVNKSAVEPGTPHARLTWGPAQAGVAGGVADAVRGGTVDPAWLLIAAVWVDPAAADAGAVYRNNREATRRSLEAGVGSLEDSLEAFLEAAADPRNPFYP